MPTNCGNSASDSDILGSSGRCDPSLAPAPTRSLAGAPRWDRFPAGAPRFAPIRNTAFGGRRRIARKAAMPTARDHRTGVAAGFGPRKKNRRPGGRRELDREEVKVNRAVPSLGRRCPVQHGRSRDEDCYTQMSCTHQEIFFCFGLPLIEFCLAKMCPSVATLSYGNAYACMMMARLWPEVPPRRAAAPSLPPLAAPADRRALRRASRLRQPPPDVCPQRRGRCNAHRDLPAPAYPHRWESAAPFTPRSTEDCNGVTRAPLEP
jgi:hypothetical protein